MNHLFPSRFRICAKTIRIEYLFREIIPIFLRHFKFRINLRCDQQTVIGKKYTQPQQNSTTNVDIQMLSSTLDEKYNISSSTVEMYKNKCIHIIPYGTCWISHGSK